MDSGLASTAESEKDCDCRAGVFCLTNLEGGSMYNGVASPEACADITTFVRNRYFYGKLLDVSHFESEQAYFNEKRWLLNRLVTGYGVICGLNVGLTDDAKQIWVDPG